MRGFRFLHTADLHLGTPFQGLQKRVPAAWLERLQQSSYRVFARIVELAVRERVEFVTMAGDLFDAQDVSMSVQFELHRGFERLREHGILVFASHGNHDPLTPSTRPLMWPDNVHIFDAAPRWLAPDYQTPSVSVTTHSGDRVQIAGFSYGQPEMVDSLAQAYVRQPDADFAIALYHGTVGPAGDHDRYCPARLEDLERSGFDFWGLGHIHKPAVLRPQHPVILYPGNPQGRHIREDGARGCTLVEVDAYGESQLQFLDTAEVLWHVVEIDLTGIDDVAAVFARIVEQLQQVVGPYGQRGHVIRLALTGRTMAHRALMQLDEVWQGLQEDFDQRGLPILLERLDVHTKPALDLDTLTDSSEFVGEWLRLVGTYKNDLATARTLLLPQLKDLFHSGNGLTYDDMSDEELLELLALAERMTLQDVGDGEATV